MDLIPSSPGLEWASVVQKEHIFSIRAHTGPRILRGSMLSICSNIKKHYEKQGKLGNGFFTLVDIHVPQTVRV